MVTKIREYNKIGKDIKSIELRPQKNKRYLDVYIGNDSLIITAPKVKFVKRDILSKFAFALIPENTKDNKKFKSFNRHLIDAIAKQLSTISKSIYGKFKYKKYFKELITPIVDDKGNMYIDLYDSERVGKRSVSLACSINSIIDKEEISEEDAMKNKQSYIRAGISVFRKKVGGKWVYYKEVDKKEELDGVTVDTFSSKFHKGDEFDCKFIIDSVELGKNKINISISPYSMTLVKKVSPKKKVYEYSDSEEESEYESEGEKEDGFEELEEEKEKVVEEPVKVEEKKVEEKEEKKDEVVVDEDKEDELDGDNFFD